jgi:hypothetical protein
MTRRGYALPVVLVVLGLLTVAVTALGFAVRASVDNARLLAAGARARGAAQGVQALVEGALLDAVAAGRTVLVEPASVGGTAWELVRAEGGNTCVPRSPPTNEKLRAVPALAARSEQRCFRDWLAQSGEGLSIERIDVSRLALPSAPMLRGTGFFPRTPVVTSAALVRVTVRDERKQAQATTTTAVQVLSASPFVFQALALGPAALPSLSTTVELAGVVHANGDLCLGVTKLARVTSAGDVGCAGDNATIDDDAVDIATASTWPVAHHRRLLDARHGVGAVRAGVSSLRALLGPPAAGDAATMQRARFADQAGVRLVDGAWFSKLTPTSTSWPGQLIWSDHVGDMQTKLEQSAVLRGIVNVGLDAIATPAAHLYSRYERPGGGSFDPGGDGVVSYGVITRDGGVHVPAAPAAGGVAKATTDEELLAGARTLVVDGTTGRRELPMNIDVAALGRALTTGGPKELGGASAWNGVLWISSTWPGRSTGASIPEPVADAQGQQALPEALCSDDEAGTTIAGAQVVPACDDAAPRATMVRVMNGDDLRVFGSKGLAIVTDLPLVIVGDWNTHDDSGTTIKSLLAADRIIAVSSDWTDGDALALPGVTGLVPHDRTSRIVAHLLTGVTPRDGRAAFVDAVATVESAMELRHDGAVVLGFPPATRTAALALERRPTKLRWDPLETTAPPGVRLAVVVDLSSTRLP